MASKDLSIIIPVYNGGEQLSKTIDSVLAQTIDRHRIEVILIDDGSTDGSAEVCDGFKAQHPDLFKVIHRQKCSGHVSTPRNDGIEAATGEYVLFFDADDLMMPEACERMVAHAKEWDSDVLNLPALISKPGEKGRIAPQYAAEGKPSVPDAFRFSDFLVNADMSARRLFSRRLIVENNLRFAHTLSEDVLFGTQALMAAKKCSMACDYIYFHYLLWEDSNHICSAQNQGWAKSFDGRLLGIRELLKAVDVFGREAAYPYLYRKIFGHCVYRLVTTGMDQRDWQAELARLPELREVLASHWNMNIAATLHFTEHAVIEGLMSESYEQLELIRTLGKATTKPRKGVKLVIDDSFEPACLKRVMPQLSSLSSYVIKRLVKAQLCSIKITDFAVEDRLLGSTLKGKITTLAQAASYSQANVELVCKEEVLTIPANLSASGSWSAKARCRMKAVEEMHLVLHIGNDSIKLPLQA